MVRWFVVGAAIRLTTNYLTIQPLTKLREVYYRGMLQRRVRSRLRQRPDHERPRWRHLGLRSRLPLRRRHLRDAADVSRAAVPVRPSHAAPAEFRANDRPGHSVHRYGPG